MDEFREPIDFDLAREAWSAGVPCPFYEVHLTATAANGRAGEVRFQFETKEALQQNMGMEINIEHTKDDGEVVAEDIHDDPLSVPKAIMRVALGAPLIATTGGIEMVYDPYEWRGGAVK